MILQIIIIYSYQVIEDIALMDVDGDECFEFCPLHFGEVSCCLVDQGVEQFEEELVGLRHHFAVVFGVLQRFGCISRPNQLDSKQAHL